MENKAELVVRILSILKAENFYNVSFDKGSIMLQGEYSSKLTRSILKKVSPTYSHINESGFVSINFKFEGVLVDITLT